MATETPIWVQFLPIIILFALAVPVTILIVVLPFWKIFSKAGFHGAFSLLMLIPGASIILTFYLAFAEWPALKKKTELEK